MHWKDYEQDLETQKKTVSGYKNSNNANETIAELKNVRKKTENEWKTRTNWKQGTPMVKREKLEVVED